MSSAALREPRSARALRLVVGFGGAVAAAGLVQVAGPRLAAADEPPAAPAPTAEPGPPAQPAPPASATPALPPSAEPPAPSTASPSTGAPPTPATTAAPTAPPATPPAPATEGPAGAPSAPRPGGEMLRWAGATFSWFHSASLATFGIADTDVPGAAQDLAAYSQSFTFAGGFFLLPQAPHQLRVSTSVSTFVELTNSDTTTRMRQPDVNDIPLRLTYTPTLLSIGQGGPIKGAAAMRDPTLLGTGDHRTWGIASGSVRFPTSRYSRESGHQLATSLTLGARQQMKLLGSDAPGLTHVVVGVNESWTHHFYRASTPVNPGLQRSRASGAGGPILSDQLSPGTNVENELGTTVSILLPLYAGLQLSTSFSYVDQFPFPLEGSSCEVETMTGCVDLESSTPKKRSWTSFDIGLSYLIVPELAVDFVYENTAPSPGRIIPSTACIQCSMQG